MSEEATTTTVSSVKAESDGHVRITVEKYNELLETIAEKNNSIGSLREQLNKARNEPPVINRTIVNKTDEQISRELRVWGGTFMGLGASLFVVGGFIYKSGRS